MATNYPASLDNSSTLPNPSASNDRNSPSLAGLNDNQNSAVIAAETKLGTGASSQVAASNTVLLGTGAGTSQWGAMTNSYVSAGTGTGSFVFATSPTITSATLTTPTINNPTLNTDAVVGYTSANNGTLYGISIASSVITQANSIGTGTIVQNGVAASQLATSAITLGYAQITSNVSATTLALVSGLSVTVTIPAGGRKVKITAWTGDLSNATAGDQGIMTIWDGTVGSGTQLAQAAYTPGFATGSPAFGAPATLIAVVTPVAGSKTYNVGLYNNGGGTAWLAATSTSPAFILVEAI